MGRSPLHPDWPRFTLRVSDLLLRVCGSEALGQGRGGGGRREREPRPAHCVPIVALHKGAASLSLSFFTYAAELKVTEKVK